MLGKVCFVPVDRNTSAIDVGASSIFKILESCISRFLSIAGLKTKVEESSNAILSRCR